MQLPLIEAALWLPLSNVMKSESASGVQVSTGKLYVEDWLVTALCKFLPKSVVRYWVSSKRATSIYWISSIAGSNASVIFGDCRIFDVISGDRFIQSSEGWL